jgi:Cdc48 subfamily AAA family protein/ClpA/ClpB-like protein
MIATTNPPAPNDQPAQVAPSGDLIALLSQKVVGQSAAMKYIVPYVYMCPFQLGPRVRKLRQAGPREPDLPAMIRLKLATIDFYEFLVTSVQKLCNGLNGFGVETAKLIGAPPGYLGHSATVPVLTRRRLTEVTSQNSNLTLMLFDEIEKALPSVTRLLLGILDKGILHLGANSVVNFEKNLIFFTSNLGAREMMKEVNPDIGFQSGLKKPRSELASKLENIALGVARNRFSPEFVNRIDAIVTYQPLDHESLDAILDHEIKALENHASSRLGDRCFELIVEPESRQFLLRKGTSEEYGARELKRTIHRKLVQPLRSWLRGAVLRAVLG